MKQKWMWFLLCVVSGAIMGLCILYPSFGPGVFVLAIPSLVGIQKQTTKKGQFLACYGFAAGICLAGYAPAFSITVNLEPIYETLIHWGLYLGLLLVHGGIMALALWFGFRWKMPTGCRVVWISLCWAAGEWMLGIGPFAWPTARVSLALCQYPVFFRSASVGGQLLVSALIMAVNGFVAYGFLSKTTAKKWGCVAVAGMLFVANLSFGWLYSTPPSATTSVAVVQPGGQAVDTMRGTVYADSFRLAQQAAQTSPHLIFLPEGIIPSKVNRNDAVQKQWGEIAKSADADMLVGGFRDGSSTVILYDTQGSRKAEYQKIKEVPFFENGKGKSFVFFSKKQSSILQTNSGAVGNLICYESMFSSMAGNCVKEGAQLLFVSTNDSWFTANMAKDIHVAHGAYRAVETGRTLVQASIDGQSAVLDAAGNMTHSLPKKSSGVLEAKVSLTPMNPLYSYVGDWWLLWGLILVLGFSFLFKIHLKKKVKTP